MKPMNVDTMVARLIFSYGVVFLNFALVIMFIKKIRFIHGISAALLFCIGVMCVGGAVYLEQFPVRHVVTDIAVFIPMLFLVPVGALFILECFGSRQSALRLLLFVFGATLLTGLAGFYGIFAGAPSAQIFAPVYALLSLMLFSVVLFEARDLRPLNRMQGGIRVFYILVCMDVVLTACMTLGQLLYFDPLLYSSWLIFIVNILFVVIIAFRSPETYRLIEEQARSLRYKRTRLNNDDAQKLLKKLDLYMKTAKPYLDPDLTLDSLAGQLLMNSHELSELLNLYKKVRFNLYINQYRIDYACNALKNREETGILEIALDSGFNNKSSFNAVFREIIGMTPREYRQNQCVLAGVAAESDTDKQV